jgi:hypothetical protein
MKFGKIVISVIGLAGSVFTAAPAFAAGNTLEVLGKCLEVPDWNVTNGTGIDIWDCNGGSNQDWILALDGTIRPAFNTSKCLDLPDWNTADGTTIDIWDCNGGTNQRWTLESNGSLTGYGNKCVDNPDYETNNGTVFDYWDCNGGTNQFFSFGTPPSLTFSMSGEGGIQYNTGDGWATIGDARVTSGSITVSPNGNWSTSGGHLDIGYDSVGTDSFHTTVSCSIPGFSVSWYCQPGQNLIQDPTCTLGGGSGTDSDLAAEWTSIVAAYQSSSTINCNVSCTME